MANASALMPTKPSKLLCERRMAPAPPVNVAVDGVGMLDGTVELPPGVVVVLDEEVELLVEAMNTPPAMAEGETFVAFTAAAL